MLALDKLAVPFELSGVKSARSMVRTVLTRWLHNFGQWNFRLTPGTLVLANQEQQ